MHERNLKAFPNTKFKRKDYYKSTPPKWFTSFMDDPI